MAAIICYATCWACKFGQCYDPPQEHTWVDSEDIEDARAAGDEPPNGRCACPCAQTGETDGSG
jgi:hypothetical protein